MWQVRFALIHRAIASLPKVQSVIRSLLLSTATIAALATSAFAADLPSRRSPPAYAPPPIPAFTWTGLYGGLDAGYAFGNDNVFATVPGTAATANYSVGRPDGVVGGGHIGYNFSTQSVPFIGQFAGAFSGVPVIGGFGGTGGVIGIEGDVRGLSYRSSSLIAGIPGTLETHRNDLQGSIRGRLGIAVDRALFFATGGAAFATFRNGYNDGVGDVATLTNTRVGYTVGGGIEYAFTNTLSLRAEYRFEDFGRYTQTFAAAAGAVPVNFTHRDTENQVTAGFSYKFDTTVAPPVVARY